MVKLKANDKTAEVVCGFIHLSIVFVFISIFACCLNLGWLSRWDNLDGIKSTNPSYT